MTYEEARKKVYENYFKNVSDELDSILQVMIIFKDAVSTIRSDDSFEKDTMHLIATIRAYSNKYLNQE